MSDKFANSDGDIGCTVFFGVDRIDKDGTSMWDPVKIGKVMFDEHFSIYSIEA